MNNTSGFNLSDYQDPEKIEDAFSALVSGGKSGYKTMIERKKEIPKCPKCDKILDGDEKFCPECGTKIE